MIQSAAMGAVFVLTAVVFYEATGFHLLNAFRRIGEHAVEFNETAGRPYTVWLLAYLSTQATHRRRHVGGPQSGGLRERQDLPVLR